MQGKLLILMLLTCSLLPSKAQYQSQALTIEANTSTVGRTFTHFEGARILAPKEKSYPFLDQLEYLLFPSLDFKKQNPGKRLQRLEMAVFGEKQKGKIKNRLNKLQNEVDSWQIANMQTTEKLNKPKGLEQAGHNPSAYLAPPPDYAYKRTRARMPAYNYSNPRYNYQHSPYHGYQSQRGNNDYTVIRPFVNQIGNLGIRKLFGR